MTIPLISDIIKFLIYALENTYVAKHTSFSYLILNLSHIWQVLPFLSKHYSKFNDALLFNCPIATDSCGKTELQTVPFMGGTAVRVFSISYMLSKIKNCHG